MQAPLPPGLPEKIPQDEQYIGRTLRQPPHIVRVPGAAERHIQTYAITLPDQFRLQVPPDSIEHLELESIPWDRPRRDVLLACVDYSLVVGRDGRILAAVEQQLHQFHEIAVHVCF